MSKMKNICIIGANSYIARNLIHKYQQELPMITMYLYDIDKEHKDNVGFYQQIDLINKKTLLNINYDCDVFYYFSAKTGTMQGFKDYETFIDVNEKGLLNFLNTYIEKKATGKIIFPSTRLLYKGSNAPVREDSELEFKTVYSLNKFCSEKYLEMFSNLYGIRYVIFRICVPYGTFLLNTNSYGTIDTMLTKAQNGEDLVVFGDGMQKRTFTHIDDLCNAFKIGAMNNMVVNDKFNIGGGDNLSIKEIADLISKKHNVNVQYVDWPPIYEAIETGDTVFDSKKFDSKVNFKYLRTFRNWINNEE